MQTAQLNLITIVAEAVLEQPLLSAIKDLGATGHTVGEVRGEGSRGRRVGELPGDNVRIEVIVGPALADAILELLATRFFPDYAVVAWCADVRVVRGEKYT